MKNRWFLLVLTSLILVPLILSGCAGGAPTAPAEGGNTLSGTIVEGGSTSVEPLARMWAGAFEVLNPGVTITVQGGGSTAGVKGVAQGLVDIGAASRELKDSEKEEWPDLVTHHIAIDGVAIVVHPSNTMSALTLEEMQNIFATGSNETWTVVNREEGSGTRECFEKFGMADTEVSTNAEFLPSNGAVKQKVATTPNAIGYISFGFVDETVKALTLGCVEPTEANLINETYPIWRYLNFITKGQPTGLAKEFIDWCFTEEAQAIAEKEGYTSILKK